MKANLTKSKWVVLSFMGITAMSGCGQSAYREGSNSMNGVPASQTGSSGTSTPTGVAGTSTSTNPTSSSSTDPSASSTFVPSPNYTYQFKLTGSSAAQSMGAVETDSVLKVTVRADQADPISGTGYIPQYNCAKVNVTVLGSTVTAFVKRAGYYASSASDPCLNAQEAVTIDFSGRLSHGHNSLSIIVSAPYSDNCYGTQGYTGNGLIAALQGGCTLRPIYSTHNVKGQLDIMVNSLN